MPNSFPLSPTEISIAAIAFAIAIGQGLSPDQKDALSNFLMLAGQYLTTVSSLETLDNKDSM